MAKKDKAVYAPGELSRIRDKLGVADQEEAKLMAQKLGGVVGYERTDDEEKNRHGKSRHDKVNVRTGGRQSRSIELPFIAENDEIEKNYEKKKPRLRGEHDLADDPSIPIKAGYWDRIKLDRFAGQPEFEIKSPTQVLYSIVSIFNDIPDYVSRTFVLNRMGEYYKKIEALVVSTRNIFPRNNMRRNETMKKTSFLAYTILDLIRNWDIEKISGDLVRIQSRPKKARIGDFGEILRAIYRPLFILQRLDLDAHIRGAYKIVYKILYLESPSEAQGKYQELIKAALSAFSVIRRDIRYLLYPLLMKTVSSKFMPYEIFFAERKNRIMYFLNVTEDNQINPGSLTITVEEDEATEVEPVDDASKSQSETQPPAAENIQSEIPVEEISAEEKIKRASVEAEKKAVERGLQTLETLFPQAGWERLSSFPDLYPYFVDVFDLKRGVINIPPTDPMQQIFILMRILQELFFGLRYVRFSTIHGISGNIEKIDGILTEIINNWNFYIEISFQKNYFPRLNEYIRIMEGSPEERTSIFTRRLITELHWLKKLYYLPYYKFEALVPPPFQRGEISAINVKIKTLRKYLSAVAVGIERGNKVGGAEAHAPCDGIDNPWAHYTFQVPNPVSIRLDTLLGPKIRNNASLVYFSLAVTIVLDNLLNSEDSWAYASSHGPLFRSENGEGFIPFTTVETKIDAAALFKQAMKQRQKKE